jgi:hypothetical protein
MNTFFRRSTATKVWNYSKPYVFRMISEMAADKARPARKLAR